MTSLGISTCFISLTYSRCVQKVQITSRYERWPTGPPFHQFWSTSIDMLGPRTVATVCTAGILFPFYIYPTIVTSCDQWQPMIAALNAHPILPFTIIVNPSSGPGGPDLPVDNYQKCLPTLRQTANKKVKLVGYVLTNYGTRASSDIIGDINIYSNWPASIKPDGIFLDQVNNTDSLASYYASFVSLVKSKPWNSATGLVCTSKEWRRNAWQSCLDCPKPRDWRACFLLRYWCWSCDYGGGVL